MAPIHPGLSMTPILPRGTGIGEQNFTKDQNKCPRYALFMKNADDGATNVTIWTCFFVIIIMLIISSHFYCQSEEKRQEFLKSESDDEPENARLEREYLIRAWRCTWVTVTILPLMFMALFVFAIAALNLQFCHGEDLMMFYWASWTLIGCGSFIAEVGLAISLLQNCLHPHHPTAPWATALGTPVPVICGMAHYVRNYFKYRHRGDQESIDPRTETSKTSSRTSFAQRARPVSTMSGIELVQLSQGEKLPEGAEILWKFADNGGLIIFLPRETVYPVSSTPSRESTAKSPSPAARESS